MINAVKGVCPQPLVWEGVANHKSRSIVFNILDLYNSFTISCCGHTVEPLYNGHFGTSHFWVIFAVISRFSSFRGKNVLAWYHWDCKTCP